MPGVHRYASRIMEAIDKDIHWYRPVDSIAAVPAPLVKATRRMPGRSVEMAIYKRDGSRYRLCGYCVVLGGARKAVRALVPNAIR